MGVFRVVIAIDPGQTGAVAVLDDGVPRSVHDMPVIARSTSGNEVNAAGLAAVLRDAISLEPAADVLVVVERVAAMPRQAEGGGVSMGATSAFNFGEGVGVIRGVCAALHLPFVRVAPPTWKKHAGLIGTPKDTARARAIELYPAMADQLKRKKDIGRADALMMGRWAHQTEQRA